VVPKLANAIVKVENSTAVKILVETTDIYDEIYKAVTDLQKGDVDGFGMEIGLLLAKLRASGCTTPVCTILEGIMASVQLEAKDYQACSADLDKAWGDVTQALAQFKTKQWVNGLKDLSSALATMADGVTACGIPDLAKILEDTATKLGANQTAAEIGTAVQILVEGADVTLDVQKLVLDFEANQWSSVGQDLGSLATWLQGTGCKTFVCKLLEGVLNGAAIPFQNLVACEGDLKAAEDSFVAGAAAMGKKKVKDAVTLWAAGLNSVAKSVQDCGISAELSFIQQEANVLGFGNITAIGNINQIIVHGADFYEDVYGAFEAFAGHDYRTAGADLEKVMNQLSQWTKGHACTSDFCYVVMGMMQYLGDIQGDIKACQADFSNGFKNFSKAVKVLTSHSSTGGSDFHFTTDKSKVKEALGDIGHGLKDVASGVSDCHLAQLAQILEELAAKLGIAPEVTWIEELLKILIDGVQIENELGDACLDFSQGNWVGFGYNIAKLVKTLIGVKVQMVV
jgi:hypothetical protein